MHASTPFSGITFIRVTAPELARDAVSANPMGALALADRHRPGPFADSQAGHRPTLDDPGWRVREDEGWTAAVKDH